MLFNRRRKPGEPEVNPEWKPPGDPVFQYLMEQALFGAVPVYYAAIPFARLKRFAPTFRPENTEHGREVVAAIMARWRAGDMAKMWVYPKGQLFIVSDDYFTLAAAEKGQPEYLPCWVLGAVPNGAAKDVQGPMDQKPLREMFGLTNG